MSEFEDYILDVGGSLDFSSGNFIDNGKGLFLTKKEIEVLDNYGISYQNLPLKVLLFLETVDK